MREMLNDFGKEFSKLELGHWLVVGVETTKLLAYLSQNTDYVLDFKVYLECSSKLVFSFLSILI
jgi:hypothetical protein